MYPIVRKEELNETTTLMEVEAPLVARKAKPGQFIIFRIDEEGERVPLTIAGYDREKGTVTIIFQRVGYTTEKLNTLEAGDALLDFVGPLGEPSETEGIRRAAVIGGGLGVAIAYPQAKALHDAGAEVDLIVGFRNEHLIILKDELEAACTNLIIMTDDGSNGNKGFVTQALEKQLDKMRRELLRCQLRRGNLINLERITFPADQVGKRRQKQGAEVELTGKITRQQGDVVAGPGRRGYIRCRRSVSQLLRFLQHEAPGVLRNGTPAVENLGNGIPGKAAGIRDVLHGDSSGGHCFGPFCLHLILYVYIL